MQEAQAALQERHLFGPAPELVSGYVGFGQVTTQAEPRRYAILAPVKVQEEHVVLVPEQRRHKGSQAKHLFKVR